MQPASRRTLVPERSSTNGGHREKTAAKSSAHAHTVPPRPPTTTTAAKKRANTHVCPPVMQRGSQRGRRLLRTRAHDVSSPALQRRPLATLAATGTHVDANGSSLGAERVTAPRPTPPALQPRPKLVHQQGLPPTRPFQTIRRRHHPATAWTITEGPASLQ